MKFEHAVVIGGSMAGLLAARALADHAEQVTILDRDVLPEPPEQRRGVPQGAHVHILLPGGEAAIERLLPGIGAEFVAAGTVELDFSADVAWLTPWGWAARPASSLHMFSCTREFFEWAVRRRVLALPSVETRGGSRVSGLVEDGDRISGVELDDGEVLGADLVVDASGRTSSAPAWLQALGHRPPEETIVDADLGYASRVIDAPADAIPGAVFGIVQVAPPEHLRGGVAVPIENGRWLLTLIGAGGDHPPRDDAGFVAFAQSLRDPILADFIAAGRSAGPISVFGATSNRFRHFERLRDQPAGFLVTGDAACAFNPVYGQGMSTAAFAAEALSACLRRNPTPAALTRGFPRAFAKAVKVPWQLATAADFDLAGIRPPLAVRGMNRYVAKVIEAGTLSAAARLPLLEVLCLTRPPQTLFAPRVVAAALRHRAPTPPSAAIPAGS
jgi:2-polyprenyl-6-methoxyphenol hydroxylase-like FAD-dependent oxidoreductase